MELSPIKAVELAASKIPGVVSLAQGIPSFDTPSVIKQFVSEQLLTGACDRYSLTTGLQILREEIALSLSPLKYDPDSEIIITVGSIEAISASLLSILAPGDNVIIPSPSYASYQGAVKLARGIPKFVPLDEDRNFDFSLELISDAITPKTRAILISNPNNPTGTIYSSSALKELVELAEKHNLIIISDEVYDQFYYNDHIHQTPASFSKDRVIRVCSFSKSYAMTGWRVGFVHSDKARISNVLKYHDAMVTCAPVVSQYAALAALKYGKDDVKKFQSEFRSRRDRMIKWLDSLSAYLDYQTPQAAYFVFPRIKDSVEFSRDSRAFCERLLNEAKVAVVPGIAFGSSGEGHFRISYGRTPEAIDEGMERIANYLDKKSFKPKPPKPQNAKMSILQLLAKIFIKRNKPFVVGIAGTHGKTTAKRVIRDYLESEGRKVRGGVLSHNTASGLPFSILGINVFLTSSKAKIIFTAILRALFKVERNNILILEYGVSSESEAKVLLSICKPDLLVVFPTDGKDMPGVEELKKSCMNVKSIESTNSYAEAAVEIAKGVNALFSSENRPEISCT